MALDGKRRPPIPAEPEAEHEGEDWKEQIELMSTQRKIGIAVGALAMVGSLFLIFHFTTVTVRVWDGSWQETLMVWQAPYGPVGALLLLVGGATFFACFPGNRRLDALGMLMALSSIALAAGFRFNQFHTWWWCTCKAVFPLGVALAAAGGFLIARSLAKHRRIPLWAVAPAFLLSIGLAAMLVYACVMHGGSHYHDRNGYYNDYCGDYLGLAFLIMAFQVLVSLSLFAGLLSGLISSRFVSSPKRGIDSEAAVGKSGQGLLP